MAGCSLLLEDKTELLLEDGSTLDLEGCAEGTGVVSVGARRNPATVGVRQGAASGSLRRDGSSVSTRHGIV